MKLQAEWIVEADTEFCVVCNMSKSNTKFLIIHVPVVIVRPPFSRKKYIAICEECLR